MSMKDSYTPSDVLLIGSLPAKSTQDAFRKVSQPLGLRLRSIPDGETGTRFNYIGWQLHVFPQDTIRFHLGGTERSNASLEQFSIESIKPTQYDDVAIDSYATFTEMRIQGVFPLDVRFQVSVPTPFNCIQGHVRTEFQSTHDPLKNKRFIDSMKSLLKSIPSTDLAIQLDLCFDVIALEYESGRSTDDRFKPHFFKPDSPPVKQGILDRLTHVWAVIPPEVKLGFYLCYGDLRHKHFVEPEDLNLVVELANDIVHTLRGKHDVGWVHMPVPKGRCDAAYFQPLKGLRIPESRLYLGLIHAHDEQGTRARIQVAHEVYGRSFGIATECGMGRTPVEDVDSILRILESVTVPRSKAALKSKPYLGLMPRHRIRFYICVHFRETSDSRAIGDTDKSCKATTCSILPFSSLSVDDKRSTGSA